MLVQSLMAAYSKERRKFGGDFKLRIWVDVKHTMMFALSTILSFPELTYSYSEAFIVCLQHSEDSGPARGQLAAAGCTAATKAKGLALGASCYRDHYGTRHSLVRKLQM